jgi:peptidoglycan/LPS O-acetylase OafA/YrhL
MKKNKSDYNFPVLTGVRAIAAFMVFCHHYIGTCGTGIFFSFVKEFYTGVTIFFVLSGFLIYYRYSESVTLKKDFLINYFKNRFARIYPVYFLIVGITSLLYIYGQTRSNIGNQLLLIFLQLTFIRGFSDVYKFIGVGQGWTLTVEECFYSLFPLLISLIKKWGFMATLLGVYIAGILLTGLGMFVNSHGFFSPPEFVLNYTFFGRVAEFFSGMYLAKIVLAKGIQQPQNQFPKFTILGLAGIVGGIFLMSRFEETCTYGTFYPGGIIVNNLILPIYISTMFYGLINERSIIQKFLGNGVMVLFGKTSYVFYLIHVGVLQFILEDFVTSNPLIIFILMNLFAVGIYMAIEEPLRKSIRRIKFRNEKVVIPN